MSSVVQFIRTLGMAIVISFVMFTLLHLEQSFRSSHNTNSPTGSYVSVVASTDSTASAPWWSTFIDTIRFGN